MTVQETLTALLNSIIEGLARYGCGLGGIYYENDRDIE